MTVENTDTYTVPSLPPTQQTAQRRSRWEELFAECREHPREWRRVVEPLKRSTAAQMASDIRNAHNRDHGKSRMRGLLEGDRWEAVWAQSPEDPNPDNYYIWLRFVG